MFEDFVRYRSAESGHASLANVVTKEKRDEMERFVLAETFKYFLSSLRPAGDARFQQGYL